MKATALAVWQTGAAPRTRGALYGETELTVAPEAQKAPSIRAAGERMEGVGVEDISRMWLQRRVGPC